MSTRASSFQRIWYPKLARGTGAQKHRYATRSEIIFGNNCPPTGQTNRRKTFLLLLLLRGVCLRTSLLRSKFATSAKQASAFRVRSKRRAIFSNLTGNQQARCLSKETLRFFPRFFDCLATSKKRHLRGITPFWDPLFWMKRFFVAHSRSACGRGFDVGAVVEKDFVLDRYVHC